MGLFGKAKEFIKGELIDIVEWVDDSRDTMVYKFDRKDNEIKNGAQLIVREGQQALFVDQGQIADVFFPGRYELKTENLPILSKLKGWKYGFESPFKAEVFFVSTRRFTDLKWGLKNPIMLRDPEFGPVRIRAFGTYEIKVVDGSTFLREIVGTDRMFTSDEITDQLRNMVVSRFADVVGESKIPVLDMAANYDELGEYVSDKIRLGFVEYGLELTKLLVENISLPPAVEEALDKRTKMGVIGDLSAYTQFQAAEAMEAAAKQPGSGAGEGMGLGMGFAMAQQMARSMSPQQQPPAAPGAPGPAAPPPLPPTVQFHVAVGGQSSGPFDLATLKQQVQSGQLTRETLVWKEGMAQWTKAGDVPELQSLFGSVPPPVPPAG